MFPLYRETKYDVVCVCCKGVKSYVMVFGVIEEEDAEKERRGFLWSFLKV